MTYHIYTKAPDETTWHYNAVTGLPEHVADEKTLAYMAVRGLIYMVDVSETFDSEHFLRAIYEPDEALAEKYKDYFMRD
jgi:23S rRNA maturation-related 3'-5' exoribonuclease YhaM